MSTDINKIVAISKRARKLGFVKSTGGEVTVRMDIMTAHQANPLKLDDLLAADDFNFMHDVAGINKHLDRISGDFNDCFWPRFAV